MKFKLFLTDRDAMEYINSNYPGAIIKDCSADYAGCEDYGDDVQNYQWDGETPAMYVLDSDYNEVDKVAYLEDSEPGAYRVIVGDDTTRFDCQYRAQMAFDEAVENEHYEEDPRTVKLVYSIYNGFSGKQETEILKEWAEQ